MPPTPRKTSKTRIHRRVAAATLATFAVAVGAVTFAGTPLPQTTTSGAATTASSSAATSTAQPASSSSIGQTSSAVLTTSTS